jgi:hypothetical protein
LKKKRKNERHCPNKKGRERERERERKNIFTFNDRHSTLLCSN